MRPRPTAAAGLLLGYLGVVALLTLDPSAAVASHGARFVARLLSRWDAPGVLLVPGRPEVLCNIAMFVPLPLMGRCVLPRLGWRDWTAYCFVLSVAIEVVQGLFLAHRGASSSDVVANTAGAAVGGVLATVAVAILRAARRAIRT